MHDAIVAVQRNTVRPGGVQLQRKDEAGGRRFCRPQYASRASTSSSATAPSFKNMVLEMAEDFPKTSFAFGTSAEIGPKNVFTYKPQSEETGYINGVIAGLVTKTGIVGVVGRWTAATRPATTGGFVLGVKASNPTPPSGRPTPAASTIS
jgi:basic membrane protein A